MTTFVKATYYPNERVAEYVTAEGKRLLRQGGSLCWLLNNCGNLVAPMRDGKPAPKKTRNYVGFARAGGAGHHFFMFSSYESGREEVKAWFKRRSLLSIKECIKAYAPSHENDTDKYITDLERMSGLLGGQVVGELSDTELSKLVDALERKEGYHKDAHTRQERWVEATSISASNGSAPLAGLELQVQRGDKTETIKSNAQGQFPPIAHTGKSPVVVKAPKADGTWDKILELRESTTSRFYRLIVDWFSTSATMQSDQAPSQAKQKRTPIQYRVQPGDSLSKIAKKFHTEVADLKRHNKLSNDMIYPEQVLWIYGAGAIDTGPKIPKPVVPKVAKPAKAPAADTALVVRGQQGEGKPLAVFTAEPGRAPWMLVAVEEAKKWEGKKETEINNEINYHRQITDNDRSGGRKIPIKDSSGKELKNKDRTVQHKTKWDGLSSIVGDANPWCAAFVNYCLKQKGYPPSTRFASSFSFDEDKDKFAEIKIPVYGAIRFTTRKGGGHVCFVYGKIGNDILTLGGNQSDTICFQQSSAGKARYYIPLAYKQYAENHDEKNLPEIDVNELRKVFGKSVP